MLSLSPFYRLFYNSHVLLALTFWASICLPLQNLQAQENQHQLNPPHNTHENQEQIYPFIVKTEFHLTEISEIDEESETFKLTGEILLAWQDSRRSFNPETEGTNTKIFQGDYQVYQFSPAWYPQWIVTNSTSPIEKNASLLKISSDGLCELRESFSVSVKSPLYLRRFPFDRQQLQLEIALFAANSEKIALQINSGEKSISASNFKISQWQFLGLSSQPTVDQDGLIINFKVARQSFFILRLVVIPLMLIVILSWCVFWMERSSLGDRINISFVGILTAVAYQMVIADILPHLSYMTLINGFVNICLFTMAGSVLESLVVGYADKQGKSRLGDRIDYLCRWLFPALYFAALAGAVLIAFTAF